MLKADNLGHHYRGGPWLFRGVELEARPGEVLTVLGPNARGKTTLLTCLAGVRTPVEGTVHSDGPIGYVPQSHAANHQFTVHDMVLMGRARTMRVFASPSAADSEAAWEALERVGIAHLGGATYAELSGGQRQLTLIARALVATPSTLILDEPTSALDLRNQRRVLTIIRTLAAEGLAIIMTTHDPAHAFLTSRTTLVMDADDLSIGETARQLTETRLSTLYRTPIRVRDVPVDRGSQCVVVPDFSANDDAASSASTPPSQRKDHDG
ncbi:ABC transporter ATP-binding protein [Actinotignum timonense]|uniref:ABC transporter ATP-binding protein n=1 Tax=Actinotignum TaxID=1653174 RepID=UPI002A800037|nr:ABC transporter ATP-binding protein [Actinotignum timonense]MDY5137654.1 ABC transporter ATP-binding protein [Actinotignum timonense]